MLDPVSGHGMTEGMDPLLSSVVAISGRGGLFIVISNFAIVSDLVLSISILVLLVCSYEIGNV